MQLLNRSVKIGGTGSYVPESVITNDDIALRAATNAKWVVENLGILERRVVEKGQKTSDLAVEAARRAIKSAEMNPEDIDLVLVATATPDRLAPSTACIVQQKLGIMNRCPAFDIHAVCSGFLYAMSIGSQFIQTGNCKNVLVIGADTFSTITDWDRRDCVFFGDGAGAVVMKRTQDTDGFFSFELAADGRGQDNFTVYPGDRYFTMNAKAVYETATEVLPQAIQSLLHRHDLTPDSISLIIPHQPSVRVLRKMAEILEIPESKVCMNMNRYANTAGASIAILLDETARKGTLKSGDLVVFAAVGSGWTWGAALYRW
jgi:3-oxoacyl-[acyl-carrier-protein] synthase-3